MRYAQSLAARQQRKHQRSAQASLPPEEQTSPWSRSPKSTISFRSSTKAPEKAWTLIHRPIRCKRCCGDRLRRHPMAGLKSLVHGDVVLGATSTALVKCTYKCTRHRAKRHIVNIHNTLSRIVGGERGTLREFRKRSAFSCLGSENNVYHAHLNFKMAVRLVGSGVRIFSGAPVRTELRTPTPLTYQDNSDFLLGQPEPLTHLRIDRLNALGTGSPRHIPDRLSTVRREGSHDA